MVLAASISCRSRVPLAERDKIGKTADFVRDYVRKGAKYAINAHVQTGSYEKDGHKVYTTEFCIDSIEFCEKKQDFEPVPEGLNLPFDKGEA